MFPGEGKVEPDLDQAQFGTSLIQIIDGAFDDVAARSHRNDDSVSFGMSHVIEEMIGSAGEDADLPHFFFHDSRKLGVIRGAGFAILKENIGNLRCAAHLRMFGIHGPRPETIYRIPVHEFCHIGVLDQFNLLNDHGGPKSVKTMNERQAGLDARQMGDQAQVHDLLRGSRGKEGKAGLADRVDVRMIAENAEGMAGNGSRRDMKDRRHHFTRNLVHVRLHEDKAL
ncbi:MAG: hypothetical protein A4E72_00131 [Syntrophus sp. PtaU1.Bin208]|nr:MAG: hypothetical protein A4E72_00131 [Syntrophus sp. PtaU1.Bin208]